MLAATSTGKRVQGKRSSTESTFVFSSGGYFMVPLSILRYFILYPLIGPLAEGNADQNQKIETDLNI